ncbi:dTMP kinase [Nonomuraea wenchangensis]
MSRPPARSGLFIVVEGPNGVGKTTSVGLLADHMGAAGVPVHVTSEPSDAPLGRLVRHGENGLTGRALALAVAADRYHHIDTEITPALEAGITVISDRYVQSSLVLQRVDGLELDEIWQYNAHVRVPSLSCYLHHTPQELGKRLAQRDRLSRLEKKGSPEQEIGLYLDAHRFLQGRRWHQALINCRGLTPEQVTAELVRLVQRTARRREDDR